MSSSTGDDLSTRPLVQWVLVEGIGRRSYKLISHLVLQNSLLLVGVKAQLCPTVTAKFVNRFVLHAFGLRGQHDREDKRDEFCLLHPPSPDRQHLRAKVKVTAHGALAPTLIKEQWTRNLLETVKDIEEFNQLQWNRCSENVLQQPLNCTPTTIRTPSKFFDGVGQRTTDSSLEETTPAGVSPSPGEGVAPQTRSSLKTTTNEKEPFILLVIPFVLFMLEMEASLRMELRGEFVTADPFRRLNVSLNIVSRAMPLVILCGGTSGCGKSTLAALMATRFGIHTVISTDSVREMLRGQADAKKHPELLASSYSAHEVAKKHINVDLEPSNETTTLRGCGGSPTNNV